MLERQYAVRVKTDQQHRLSHLSYQWSDGHKLNSLYLVTVFILVPKEKEDSCIVYQDQKFFTQKTHHELTSRIKIKGFILARMAIITDNKTKVSRNIKAELFFTEKHKQKEKQQHKTLKCRAPDKADVPATFISVIYY